MTKRPPTPTSAAKRKGGLEQLLRINSVGGEALLDEAQVVELEANLEEHFHLRQVPYGDYFDTFDKHKEAFSNFLVR